MQNLPAALASQLVLPLLWLWAARFSPRWKILLAGLLFSTVVSGLVVADAPGSVTIRMAGGAERVIKRGEIEESQQLASSIMPVGLEAVITLQDCADLLAALRE